MSSSINKPTGKGYTSSLQRVCADCAHIEMRHYGNRCYAGVDCDCVGMTARKLDSIEKAILTAEKAKSIEYLGEAWMDDLMREWKHRDIGGL